MRRPNPSLANTQSLAEAIATSTSISVPTTWTWLVQRSTNPPFVDMDYLVIPGYASDLLPKELDTEQAASKSSRRTRRAAATRVRPPSSSQSGASGTDTLIQSQKRRCTISGCRYRKDAPTVDFIRHLARKHYAELFGANDGELAAKGARESELKLLRDTLSRAHTYTCDQCTPPIPFLSKARLESHSHKEHTSGRTPY